MLCISLVSQVTLHADVSGNWSGSSLSRERLWPWDASYSTEGTSQPFFMILKEHGSSVEGSVGPDEVRQYAVRNGSVDGAQVSFDVAIEASSPVAHFHLIVSGDHLDGGLSAEGVDLSNVKVSLRRVPSGVSQDARTLLKNGAAALRDLDYSLANNYFEHALARKPDFVDAYMYLGASHYRQGLGNDFLHPDLTLLNEAGDLFHQVLKLESRNTEVRMYVGSILAYQAEAERSVEMRIRELEEAKAVYRKAADLDARNFDALYMTAVIDRREIHEYLTAARAQLGLQDSTGLLPDTKERRELLIRIDPLYDDAIESLVRATRVRPGNDELVKCRYACMREKAQLAGSEEQYRDALEAAKQWLAKAQEEAQFARNRPRTAEDDAEMRKRLQTPEIMSPPSYVLPSLDFEEELQK